MEDEILSAEMEEMMAQHFGQTDTVTPGYALHNINIYNSGQWAKIKEKHRRRWLGIRIAYVADSAAANPSRFKHDPIAVTQYVIGYGVCILAVILALVVAVMT